MRIEDLLVHVVDNDANNLLLLPGSEPLLSIDGLVYPMEMEPVPDQLLQQLISSLLESDISPEKITHSVTFSKEFADIGRFRINIFRQNNHFGAVLRRIPFIVPQFNDLGLPGSVMCPLLHVSSGLIIVTGQAESGRSTTLAAMLNYLNETFPYHIVTLEHPTEFMFKNHRSIFDQRGIPGDSNYLLYELEALDKQDVHAVMVQGNLSSNVFEALLHTAEMGRLVLLEFPAPDIVQALEDIIFSIPKEKRTFFTNRLALILKAVIGQRLLQKVSGRGRSLAYELLINTKEASTYIHDMKLQQLITLMESNSSKGMQTLEMSLSQLYMEGEITQQVATQEARRPQNLKSILRQME